MILITKISSSRLSFPFTWKSMSYLPWNPRVNFNDFKKRCCPFSSWSQPLQFLCRMLNYPSYRNYTFVCPSSFQLTGLTAGHIWKYPKERNQIFLFVHVGSGFIKILSEISVAPHLPLLSWWSWSTTASTNTQAHQTTPECSRGKTCLFLWSNFCA